ncbi:MAG: prenyltransferase [Candidatus Azosocius agrarius]|nr:MAG: prenyltransferase [Gammaproteobacteria bacterium]
MTSKEYGTIKCDPEGKILKFDHISEKIFECTSKEIINKKRIFYFFSKINILNNINKWKNLTIINETKIYTILKTKRNNIFFAYLNIIPYTKNNTTYFSVQIFSLPQQKNFDSLQDKQTILQKIKNFSHIIRIHFLLGTIIPIIFGIFWSYHKIESNKLNIMILFCTILGTICCHIAANTFNDYYDWKSKTDKINKNYILFITGGSRSIEMGLINEKSLLILSIINTIIVIICGLYISYMKGITILIIGLIGIFGTYFYSAPPIKLSSRHGLGEIFHIICLGPLIIIGITYILTNKINYNDFFVGLPMGFLITACLLINEYPDLISDKITKKKNLAVTLKKYFFLGLITLIIIPYIIILLGIIFKIVSYYLIITFITIPYIIYNLKIILKISQNRNNLIKSCIIIFNLYLYFSILMIIGQIIYII